MIVADTNLVAYLLLPGPLGALAEAVMARDPDWRVPALWRSEFTNVLVQTMRSGSLAPSHAAAILEDALGFLAKRTYAVDPQRVLERAMNLKLSGYDAEYVVLAETLGVPLVTADKQLIQRTSIALHPEKFLHA